MVLQPGRWTAELDGDFFVFLIGAMVHDPAVATEASGLLMAMRGTGLARTTAVRPASGMRPSR